MTDSRMALDGGLSREVQARGAMTVGWDAGHEQQDLLLPHRESKSARRLEKLRKRGLLSHHRSLLASHKPLMPSVLASKSITYAQLPQQIFTTPLSSVRFVSPASKSVLT